MTSVSQLCVTVEMDPPPGLALEDLREMLTEHALQLADNGEECFETTDGSTDYYLISDGVQDGPLDQNHDCDVHNYDKNHNRIIKTYRG